MWYCFSPGGSYKKFSRREIGSGYNEQRTNFDEKHISYKNKLHESDYRIDYTRWTDSVHCEFEMVFILVIGRRKFISFPSMLLVN